MGKHHSSPTVSPAFLCCSVSPCCCKCLVKLGGGSFVLAYSFKQSRLAAWLWTWRNQSIVWVGGACGRRGCSLHGSQEAEKAQDQQQGRPFRGVPQVTNLLWVGLTSFLPPLSNTFRLSIYQLVNPLTRSELSWPSHFLTVPGLCIEDQGSNSGVLGKVFTFFSFFSKIHSQRAVPSFCVFAYVCTKIHSISFFILH